MKNHDALLENAERAAVALRSALIALDVSATYGYVKPSRKGALSLFDSCLGSGLYAALAIIDTSLAELREEQTEGYEA